MVRVGIAKHQQPKLWLLVSVKSWKILVCQDKGFSLIEDIPTFPSGPVPIMIDRLTNHVVKTVTFRHYIKADPERLRAPMQKIENFILEHAGVHI